MKLHAKYIAQGRADFLASMTGDDTITSFGIAMKRAGYKPILTANGCLVMRDCKICRVGSSSYSTKYEKDGVTVWACPYCEEVTEQ